MVAQEHADQARGERREASAPGPARYSLPAYRPLLERGISAQTLAAFEVTSGRWAGEDGWLYPVYGPGRVLLGCRFKSGAPRPRHKYGWVESQEGASSVLYGAGCVQPARPVVLCAGEPDAWLLHTLKLPGCTFLRGEGAGAPTEGIADLVSRTPSLVLVVYDRDETGERGARRTARALRDAGLRARALALPSDLPEGGDLADLYWARGHSRQTFMAVLAGCRDLDVPPARAARRAPPAARRGGPWEEFNATHDLVEMVHDVVRLRKSGTSWLGLCPFHGDTKPSFHVYRTHYFCYGCRRRGDAYDFDRWLKGEA